MQKLLVYVCKETVKVDGKVGPHLDVTRAQVPIIFLGRQQGQRPPSSGPLPHGEKGDWKQAPGGKKGGAYPRCLHQSCRGEAEGGRVVGPFTAQPSKKQKPANQLGLT